MPNVRIRIEKEQEAGGEAQQTQPKSEAKNVATQTFFAHQMLGTAKQIVRFQASNVGNFTGNYIKQEQINQTLDVLGDASTIALGFAAKGPIGAVVATIGIGTKHVLKAISDAREDELRERDRLLVMERSGNSTRNGSRGTEN